MQWRISTATGILFLKGIFMGLSMALPGISGGTMAFILGIYKKLINEISKFHISDFKSPKTFFQKYDWLFLIPLLAGSISALALFVILAPPLITSFQFEFYSLIFGFILASLYLPLKEIEKSLKTLILFVCFTVLSFYSFYFTETISLSREQVSLFWIFPAGALVALALVVPGLSGSYLLILLGLYHYILTAFRDLNMFIIGVFIIGAFIGLISMARGMKFFLHRFPSETLSVILGLIVGSLYILWPFSEAAGGVDFLSSSFSDKISFLLWFSLSFCLTLFISFLYGKNRITN
ncbi:MAG: DUF368 domain-containing protein [Bdellovibrionales bacterium]|nr:DUF368 domain-containing protein [Bdellovibrionales bacterium]